MRLFMPLAILTLITASTALAKSKDPATQAKVERLEKIMTKSDLALTVKAECELLDIHYQTMKALKDDPENLSALSRLMMRRGCD